MKIEQNAFEIEEPKFTQCGEFKGYHQTKSSKTIPKQIEKILLKYAKQKLEGITLNDQAKWVVGCININRPKEERTYFVEAVSNIKKIKIDGITIENNGHIYSLETKIVET